MRQTNASHLRLVQSGEPTHSEVTTLPGGDELVGQVLNGRFRVLEPIGAGGMGRVYRAEQLPLGRVVALKVLSKHYGTGADPELRDRFFTEAALNSQLKHPNTVTVIDYGATKSGVLYLAMEYLEGETLCQVLGRQPTLPWQEVVTLAQQIARSVREAHQLGVVHRDLKPANVMLLAGQDGEEGQVKVLDFGLVKSFVQGRSFGKEVITRQGMLMGSPQYMAPEQAEKNVADPRSDVYSLGVLMYESLTGKPPFTGRSHVDVLLKHINDPVPPMTPTGSSLVMPLDLQRVVYRCLEKRPKNRFQSMDEVLAALQPLAMATHAPMLAPPGTSHHSWTRMLPAFLFLLAVAVGILGIHVLEPYLSRESLAVRPDSATGAASARPASATAKPAAAPVSGLERIRFHVRTDPSGARVTLKGKLLGTTPVEFDLPPNSDGVATAELAFTHPGYTPLVMTAASSGPRLELLEKLQPARSAVPSAKRKAKTRAQRNEEARAARAAEKAAAEKAAAEKAAAEKAAAEEAAAEQAATDKAATDKAAEKATGATSAVDMAISHEESGAAANERAAPAASPPSAEPPPNSGPPPGSAPREQRSGPEP